MSKKQLRKVFASCPLSLLLPKALSYVPCKGKAIDIGGGPLRDARYLLEQGFHVTVVDKDELGKEEAETIESHKLQYVVSLFENFNFPKNEYHLALALNALPFTPSKSFERVFEDIKQSLVTGGIFSGQCFGVNDEWKAGFPKRVLHTKEQLEKLLSDMEILLLVETEKDDEMANGTLKHWHIFNFIARKI